MSITSSSAERIYECLASVVLPQTPHSGVEAEHGNENHANAENESKLPDEVRDFLGTLRDTKKEVSFVLDTQRRTIQHTGERRAYGKLSAYQIGTTPDVVGFDGDGVPVSLDFKSRKRVTSALRNWQIRSQALAISMFGARVKSGIAYLDDGYMDIAEFGPIQINAAWADLHDLCEAVEKIKAVHREFPTSTITPQRGEWCTYCPALLSCPAQRAALATFKSELAVNDIDDAVLSMDEHKLYDLFKIWKQLEKRGEQFEKAVKARAKLTPIHNGKGKMLEMRSVKGRPSTDWQALEEKLASIGDDIANYQITKPQERLMEVNDKVGALKDHG